MDNRIVGLTEEQVRMAVIDKSRYVVAHWHYMFQQKHKVVMTRMCGKKRAHVRMKCGNVPGG